ncbi:MAG: TonB-dependent receptor plug domain-containing protein, partial [Acidimicrobiales bacterium]|nr:TonB-dependent receptor plug domain-containing protein [Acidimicrobiales bacterium]
MLILGLLGAVLVVSPPEPADTPGLTEARCESQATWIGTLVDGDTGEAVPGAQVELRPWTGARAIYARSDDSGQVRVEGLCSGGKLRVRVRVREHAPAEELIDLAGSQVETTLYLEPLHDHHSERVIVVHDDSNPTMGSSVHIAGAELAKTRGLGLADAISGVSGVSTMRGIAGGMGKPVIRGQVGRRNLIVFDGVRHE